MPNSERLQDRLRKNNGGYDLPARYVIHTVGPVWRGGMFGEKALLESCYKTSLKLAMEYGCESVAFPLISAGVYGYPKDKAIRVAMNVITEFLVENDITVYLVIFDQSAFQISAKLFREIREYIDDRYVDSHEDSSSRRLARMEQAQSMAVAMAAKEMSLHDVLWHMDESFSEMLLRKTDEKGMKDSDCYKKANIDRKLFSKIRSDRQYRPSKPTVLAFAIALELPLDETKDMLQKAGFALSHSNQFDIIVEYFIQNGKYDIFEINEALFAFDQSLLGG